MSYNRTTMLFTPTFFRIFIPFGAAYFMSLLLGSTNAIMSRTLVETFGLSSSELGLMSSAYLASFAAMQFPLGVMLDRYGARRTLAPLLLFAAAGSLLFGMSRTGSHLIAARALLGIGLAGCLMAAYKAYADWIERDRLPVAYSVQCLAGGIGGMAATRPLALAFDVLPWRTVFLLFAAATLAIALLVWFVVPEKPRTQSALPRATFATQFRHMLRFLTDGRFWYIAPVITAAQGVLFAYLYLWLGPWLRDVAGLPERETGMLLMLSALGTAVGYFLNGILAEVLRKKGWMSWETMYLVTGVLFVALMAAISAGVPCAPYLWPFVMFLSTMTMISFPLMRNLFDDDEVGRVLSLLNFTIFVASFAMQWLVGAILERYPTAPDGGFSPAGYSTGLVILTATGAAAVAHLAFCLRRRGKL
ncbi:MFS transporter [Synergistaceae bacterium OttesenSCG-928-I11]|nr:MFS transporter [Synergistaceae bacterium OttesenSCG-928-I11]